MLTIYGIKRLNDGTRASRKLRLKNKFPAIIYCLNKPNICIELDQKIVFKLESMHNYRDIEITIIVSKIKYFVKIKEIQRHAFKAKIMHMDFLINKNKC